MATSTQPEQWAQIPSIPTHEVSTHARVRRIVSGRNWKAGKVLAGWLDGKGYMRFELDGVPRSIHSLICEAFNGPPKPGQVCRHLNDDKTDNRPENLAWGSHADNTADAMRNGCRGGNPRRYDLAEAKRLRTLGLTNREIAYFLGVSQGAIAIATKAMPSAKHYVRERLRGN